MLVVGAAVVHRGRVLAARRTRPEATAGGWEFPGGKVDPGESMEDAVVREVGEELGCVVRVTRDLAGEVPIGDRYTLPHRGGPPGLGAPPPVDRGGAGVTGLRAVFYEEDDARAVAEQLARDGFEASVGRERLAGEDDDEDHPWAVLSDAPAFVLELLADARDGWVEHEEAAPSGRRSDVPPPPPLPDAPRRVKGHFTDGRTVGDDD